jgi:hypothetical protein
MRCSFKLRQFDDEWMDDDKNDGTKTQMRLFPDDTRYMSLGDEASLCSGISNDKDSPTKRLARTWSDHDHGPWATGSAAGRKPLHAGVYIHKNSLSVIMFILPLRPRAPLYNLPYAPAP